MILTIKPHNKNTGLDLPMYSRTGKATTSSYLVFSGKGKNRYGSCEQLPDDEPDNCILGEVDDVAHIMGRRKQKNNINDELQKIHDDERLEAI